MHFQVLTLFPDLILNAASTSITGRAMKSGAIRVEAVNIRDFATNDQGHIDDYPYGGGAGIIMQAEPVYRAVTHAKEQCAKKPRVVYLTPQAKVLDQTMVEDLAQEEELILLCGHYEGIDERVIEEVATDVISIGDYVLTGGELGALVLIDAISRFVPGVLGNDNSMEYESHMDGLLEYPQYTRPEHWRGRDVPPVLLTGDHVKIEAWRKEQSLARTEAIRPDLLAAYVPLICASFGGDACFAACDAFAHMLSNVPAVLNYDRRRNQRSDRALGARDLFCLFVSGDADDAECAAALSRLTGEGTAAYLIDEAGDAAQRLPMVREELAEAGFLVLDPQADASGTGPAGDAIERIRRRMVRYFEGNAHK